MVVRLNPEMEKLIEEKLTSGPYRSAEDLVNAALEQFMAEDDLEPGELERLLAVGEAQATAGQFIDGDEAFHRIQARSDSRRRAR
jgi:Arc/MetJ-type ribon-helix-helix transcriptional regulator